jgi:SAM domain (Sterile alpha motif)
VGSLVFPFRSALQFTGTVTPASLSPFLSLFLSLLIKFHYLSFAKMFHPKTSFLGGVSSTSLKKTSDSKKLSFSSTGHSAAGSGSEDNYHVGDLVEYRTIALGKYQEGVVLQIRTDRVLVGAIKCEESTKNESADMKKNQVWIPRGSANIAMYGTHTQSWACEACTYINEPDTRGCTMCATKRPPIARVKHQPDLSSVRLMKKMEQPTAEVVRKRLMERQTKEWNVEDVCMYLWSVGFGNYTALFREKLVDGELFKDITAAELEHDFDITTFNTRVAVLGAVKAAHDNDLLLVELQEKAKQEEEEKNLKILQSQGFDIAPSPAAATKQGEWNVVEPKWLLAEFEAFLPTGKCLEKQLGGINPQPVQAGLTYGETLLRLMGTSYSMFAAQKGRSKASGGENWIQHLSAMTAYSRKSAEELRWEDYLLVHPERKSWSNIDVRANMSVSVQSPSALGSGSSSSISSALQPNMYIDNNEVSEIVLTGYTTAGLFAPNTLKKF